MYYSIEHWNCKQFKWYEFKSSMAQQVSNLFTELLIFQRLSYFYLHFVIEPFQIKVWLPGISHLIDTLLYVFTKRYTIDVSCNNMDWLHFISSPSIVYHFPDNFLASPTFILNDSVNWALKKNLLFSSNTFCWKKNWPFFLFWK